MSRSQQAETETISDTSFVMPWGKYRGQSIQNLLENDPRYLAWVATSTTLDFSYDLQETIEDAVQRWRP
jgi:hypothetical protein